MLSFLVCVISVVAASNAQYQNGYEYSHNGGYISFKPYHEASMVKPVRASKSRPLYMHDAEEKSPMYEPQKSVYKPKEPMYEMTKPMYEQPKPAYEQMSKDKESMYEAPHSRPAKYEAKKPMYEPRRPMYVQYEEPAYMPYMHKPKYMQDKPMYYKPVFTVFAQPRRHYDMMFKQPEPAYMAQEPEPSYKPVHKQTESAYMAHEPAYGSPEPAYMAHRPAYKQPELTDMPQKPAYKKPEPAYKKPEPAYEKPEPYMAYTTPKPVYKQPEPSYAYRPSYQPRSPYAPQQPMKDMKKDMKDMQKDMHTSSMASYGPAKPSAPKMADDKPKYLGKFKNPTHMVEGDIFQLDEHTLYIQGFSFDGQAPEVYFWSDGVPIPFYTRSNPKMQMNLHEYHKEDVVLMLPPEKPTLDQLGHFQIWCNQYKIVFGEFTMES